MVIAGIPAIYGKPSYTSIICLLNDAARRADLDRGVLGDMPDRTLGLQPDPAVIVVPGGQGSRAPGLTAAERNGRLKTRQRTATA